MGGRDDEVLERCDELEKLPTDVPTLSDANDVAELVANDGAAAAQNNRHARLCLKWFMVNPGFR